MKAACIGFRSKLAGLFSGSHTYSTTQMQDWRVRKGTERAYGHNRVLSSSMFLFHVVEREVYLRKVSLFGYESSLRIPWAMSLQDQQRQGIPLCVLV
jgi:hypothetical protein